MEKIRFTVRVPEDLKKYYDDMSEERGLRLNALIIIALEEYKAKNEEIKRDE